MFATPQRHQIVDKENVGSKGKTPGKSLDPLATPVRKPLASLNQDHVATAQSCQSSGKMLQKIWTPGQRYTPTRVTSASNARGKKYNNRRKSKASSSKTTVLSVTEAAESLLNQVLLKEMAAVAHFPQVHSAAWMHSPSMSDRDQSLQQAVAGLVDGVIHAALRELTNEKEQGATCSIPTKIIHTESLALDPTTPTTDSLWSIALGPDESVTNLGQDWDDTSVFLEDNLSGISSDLSLFGGGCSSDASPVMKICKSGSTPANHHEGRETIPALSIRQDNLDGKSGLVPSLSEPASVASCREICETDQSVQNAVQKLEMTDTSLVELEPLMKVMPAENAVGGSCTVPVEVPPTSHGTRPYKSADTSDAAIPAGTRETTNATDVVVINTPVHSDKTAMIDSVGVTPAKSNGIFTRTTTRKPVSKTDSRFMTTPIYTSDAYNGTPPIKMTDSTTTTNPIKLTDASIGTTPLGPVDVPNKSVVTTFDRPLDTALGTASKPCSDANYGTTPVRVSTSSTVTTPTSLMDASVGTTPCKPVETSDKSVEVTPVKTSDAAAGTAPVESSHAVVGTTPRKMADVGLCTDPASVADSSTGTSPVRVAEVGVGTGLYPAVDAQCGSTPVGLVDVRCGTSPCTSLDVGTAVTPLVLSTAQTLTSPIVVPAFKLEAESPSQLDATSLVSHLESACISNELLRREIRTLKTTKSELQHQLDGTREQQLDQRGAVERLKQLNPKVELRQVAKGSLQTEIDNLLLQGKEQMNQLTFLQEALDQKSAELSAANLDRMNLGDQYQKEIYNLQQDLCTAYKQQQQEVSNLQAFYEQNNYEPHYRRAMATVAELETEMQAYRGLNDTLDKAAKIQEQFGCIEEAYSLVNALFTKTMDKKDELEIQHVEMVDVMNQTKMANEQLQRQLAAAGQQQRGTQAQLQDAVSAEKEALKCQGQLLRELDDVSQVVNELNSELRNTKSELFAYKSDYETLVAKTEELDRQSIEHLLTETTMEAALVIQSKQWQDSVLQMERVRSTAGEEVKGLKLQNARFVAEAAALKRQQSTGQDIVTALRSELERNKEKIKTLQRQFQENIEFIEEERVALVESARESEDQVKITSLELSRLKTAFTKAEEMGSRWKGAAENLSEKLQLCQSELDNTKAHAHWLLLNQAGEMRDASEGLTALLKKMQDMAAPLTGPNEEATIIEPIEASKPNPTKSQTDVLPSGSLVASILNAVHSKDDDANDDDAVTQETPSVTEQGLRTPSPSSDESRSAICGSRRSAFTAVETTANQNPRAVDANVDRADESKESQDDGVPLAEQVEQARRLFGRLVKLLLARNETLESVVEELKEERSGLHAQLQKSQKLHDRELCVVREQLRESELQECRLRQEVAHRDASIAEQQQALQYAHQRLQSMADNLERFSDQKTSIEKLQTDTAKLTSSLRVAQREKSLLQEQLDSVLSGCSQSSSKVDGRAGASQPTAVNNKLIRENLSLKKELEKLRVRLVERQEHYETLNTRATKHMRVLEGNWHKADAEVYRLDELFDHCKQLMEQVPSTSDEHSGMSALRQLLN